MAQGFSGWARSRAQRLYSRNTGQASDAAQHEKTKSEGPVISARRYKPGIEPRRLAWFLARFLPLYLALQWPWPGWDGFWSDRLRAMGNTVFGQERGNRIVQFQRADPAASSSGRTRIVIVNRALVGPDGVGPFLSSEIDARSFLGKPFALFWALILATPMRLGRRLAVLLAGSTLLAGYGVLCLGLFIALREPGLSLCTRPPWLETALGGTDVALTAQLTLGAPWIIWLWLACGGWFSRWNKSDQTSRSR